VRAQLQCIRRTGLSIRRTGPQEAQRRTERPREARRGPKRLMLCTYVCREVQRGRSWIEQACQALVCLAGGLAGWLAEVQRALKDTGAPELSGVFVRQFRASRNTGAPAVGYCLVFLSCIFGPRRTLGLQLSGIVSGNFKAWGKLGTQLFVSFLSFLEKPREAQKGPERPRAAQRGSEILSG